LLTTFLTAAAAAAAAAAVQGGGIYRHTQVIVTEPVAIAPYSVYVPSEVTGTITRGAAGAPPTADATVTIQANVTGTTTALSECEDDLSFSFEIFDPTSTSVWKGTATITAGHTATTTASLKDASLWLDTKQSVIVFNQMGNHRMLVFLC